MKKSIVWLTPAAIVAVGVLAASTLYRPVSIIPQARAGDLTEEETELQCPRGDRTLRGAYMSRGGGTVNGLGPITFQGTVFLDGKGGVSNPFTASRNGTIVRVVAPGTYTIASDCTGTMTLGGANHFDLRVSPDGRSIDYIETDPGTVVSGSATRVRD